MAQACAPGFDNLSSARDYGRICIMEWHPATVDEVKKIVRDDLAECDEEQILAFKKYAVEPYVAPILRYGRMENAVVVARRGDEVIYGEDVERASTYLPLLRTDESLSIGAIRTNCALHSTRGLTEEHAR
jgi:hypothetical protein